MVRTPTLTLAKTTQATTFHFVPEARDFGWALCTVNDNTGELTIQSDWGNWSHRWSANPNHLGAPTLTHFIGDRGSAHYLAQKLAREDGPRSGEEFDAELTVARLRRILVDRRLEEARGWIEYYRDEDPEDTPDVLETPPSWATKKAYLGTHYGAGGWYEDKGEPLTRGIARKIWDELGNLTECGRSADLLIERFFRIQGHAWITDEPWEYLKYSPTPGYLVLLNSILPALIEACRARVRTTIEEGASHA